MPNAAGERARPPRVGVLSLQGDFAKHGAVLERLGARAVRVSLPEHLAALDALILPGGESSTMLRLLAATGLAAPLATFVRERPVLGTCAGLILLAADADRLPAATLGVLDVSVRRNGYGRQVHSFSDAVEFAPLDDRVSGVFIRAPRLVRVGAGVEVVARHAGEPVGVRSGRVVGLAFHPELTGDARVHRWFLEDVAGLAVTRVPTAARGEAA